MTQNTLTPPATARRDPQRPSGRRQLAAGAGMLIAVVLVAAGGALANMGPIDGWYADADKVSWTPPNWLFGPAWSILYLLIAVAGFVLWRQGFSGAGRENGARSLLMLFIVQLVLNALWSPMFFAGYPVFGPVAWWLALAIIVLLDVLVAWLIFACLKDHLAVSLLLVPYLCWILFATTLNAGIIALN